MSDIFVGDRCGTGWEKVALVVTREKCRTFNTDIPQHMLNINKFYVNERGYATALKGTAALALSHRSHRLKNDSLGFLRNIGGF